MYPDLFSKFGYFTERLIVTKEMKFFFKLLEDVLNDRLQSNEVNYLNQQRIADNFLKLFVNEILCDKQKFNDFIEVLDEAISEFTKEVDGKTVPMWTREAIDEIIMGQVNIINKFRRKLLFLHLYLM
jgi:cytochrome P450 family 3 subfamily A